MTKQSNSCQIFVKIQGFWGPQGQGVWGVIKLFHMKELQLGLPKYMKIKISLSILYFFCISKSPSVKVFFKKYQYSKNASHYTLSQFKQETIMTAQPLPLDPHHPLDPHKP